MLGLLHNNLVVTAVDHINISTSNDALIFAQRHYPETACLSILTMTEDSYCPMVCPPVYVTLEQGRPTYLLV